MATGVAGIVSAIVGLLGVSVQLGWVGGDGDGSASSSNGVPTTTASTVFGATTAAPAASARTGELKVDPQSISIEPLDPRDAIVKVENTGDVPLTIGKPTVSGAGADEFDVTDVNCTKSKLAPGRSCELKVTFTATKPGEYTAALVVAASGVPRAVEVELKGSRTLLG
ncbi:MAG TPA: choice-of-anchor D domain-containing protein [Acidimicrobiales bacterium]|nr:choice-of-anchor D domain-containing protein [Acidimicrobiales bacterium]